MLSRRAFVAGSAAALIAARHGGLLDRAIFRAGGVNALSRANVLAWTGSATVTAGGRVVEIGMSTRVEPFVRARSDSWLAKEGPSHTRSLIIEGPQGWIEREGQRTAMPEAMLAHERARYAIYGLMRLISGRDRGAHVEAGIEADSLVFNHPLAPITTFGFDADARLIWAKNRVTAADGRSIVDQRFDFSGEIFSAGVHWPKRLQIAENGSPFFDLTLDTFTASPR